MLVTDAYVADQDTHSNIEDVTNEIAAGGGYSTGGVTVSGQNITRDDTNNWSTYDAADAVWPDSTLTARAAVLYYDSGVAATSTLIAYLDFGSDKVSDAGDFVVQWHADGVFRLG